MANVDVKNGKGEKKNKPKKQLLRVDFTPMVDMNMLLITFFMFCTTLSIPKVMDIVMPTDEKAPVTSPHSKTITMMLGESNKVFYYEGIPQYEDVNTLKETSMLGMREVLLRRNEVIASKIRDLRLQLQQKLLTEADYSNQVKEVKKSKEGIIVVIKPTKDATYKNMVDALDEMLVCGVDKYVVTDLEEGDSFLLNNYKIKTELTAQAVIK